jgi:hypothetical protein
MHFQRKQIPATISKLSPGSYSHIFTTRDNPLVSIVIPTRGNSSKVWGVEMCLVENIVSTILKITKGKISPWMLYHSTSGLEFLGSLDSTQEKMIFDYINPEQWAIKFKRSANIINEVKELLNVAGY